MICVQPEPYTDRTPASVLVDPRPGDSFFFTITLWNGPPEPLRRALVVDHGVKVGDCVYGAMYLQQALVTSLADTARPRCIAADPREGDTVFWDDGKYREVVEVDGADVHTIDQDGRPHVLEQAVWAESARTWTLCLDRKGGARFDPQPGDRAYVGPDAGWEVNERTDRGTLFLVATATDTRSAADVAAWLGSSQSVGDLASWLGASRGLFPARYVRAERKMMNPGVPQ